MPYAVSAYARKNREAVARLCLFAGVKQFAFLLAPILALLLPGCQAAQSPTGGPGFEENPTDSGSRFSYFNLTGSRMAEQNVGLED